MIYCVIKGTTTIIDDIKTNNDVTKIQNAINCGYTADQVEILTQSEFDERKALEPVPIKEPSDKERIAELEQIINMILMGDM